MIPYRGLKEVKQLMLLQEIKMEIQEEVRGRVKNKIHLLNNPHPCLPGLLIDELVAKLEESNLQINVNCDIIKDFPVSDDFDPEIFNTDINHIRDVHRFKIE